jgi:ABC-type transport system substrate-binding protein
VEAGNAVVSAVAGEIAAQLRSAGLAVTTQSVNGPQAGAAAYDLALVARQSSPYQTATANWYSDGQGSTGANGNQNWSNFDDPQVDQLFAQAAQALNPVTGGAIYGQIDDQLWDQMVALPLFAEPAFSANGVQIDQVQYNPSADGILWNLAQWATLKPGPPVRKD